jgi:hypothetical protein
MVPVYFNEAKQEMGLVNNLLPLQSHYREDIKQETRPKQFLLLSLKEKHLPGDCTTHCLGVLLDKTLLLRFLPVSSPSGLE